MKWVRAEKIDPITIDWIISELANNEVSTDAELIDAFIGAGVPKDKAEKLVAKRNQFMGRIDYPEGVVEKELGI